MSAVACLRVMVRTDQSELPDEVLAALVAKFTGAFLEVRWPWPRRFSEINPYAFLLTDPRATELDTAELGRLSDELHAHLFGRDEASEVTILLFEGPQESLSDFAGLSAEGIARAMTDPSAIPPGGRLSRIAADGTRILTPPDQAAATAAPATGRAAPAPPLERAPNIEGVQGIYYAGREIFVADVISCTPADARTHFSLVDGDEHLPEEPEVFDKDCVIAAMRLLVESPSQTPLYLPVSFSTLMRPSRRAAYAEMIAILPPSERRRLAAAVYDVPRAPTFQALTQLREALEGRFGAIDLRTSDPAFEIEQLTPQAVTSVTLVLPTAEPERRLAVLRRFTARLTAYKRRRIWPGVTNIRTARELEAAREARIPFLTGPGVCRLRETPVGGRARSIEELPLE